MTWDRAQGEGDGFRLFGVVGLRREAGVVGGLGVVEEGRRRRMVVTSRCLSFTSPGGSVVRVTVHGGDSGPERYASVRAWAPMNTYLSTPAGQARLAAAREAGAPLEPVDLDWESTTVEVDGQAVPFEVCDLSGCWVAVGRASGSIVTVEGSDILLRAVRLERIEERLVPAMPDLGGASEKVRAGLDARFSEVPFGRVRGRAGYWALQAIEEEYVRRVADELRLTSEQRQALAAHWSARIERRLAASKARWEATDCDMVLNSRVARRLRHHNAAFQVWHNTVGPGARTWLGNRYMPVRYYTLRLRWRP